MKTHTMKYVLGCITMTFCIACSKGNDTEKLTSSHDINAWIFEEMKSKYLWQDELSTFNYQDYDIYANPQAFFYSLLSNHEKKGGSYYSYIEQKTPTRSMHGDQVGYGAELLFYALGLETQQFYARVLYVYPDSPAQQKGLMRGDWITHVNGQDITQSNYRTLSTGGRVEFTVYKELTEETTATDAKQLVLDGAVTYDNNPVYLTKVIPTTRGKLGYLMYNHFTSGPKDFEDKTWDNDLVSAVAELKTAQVDGVILDLRYNPGGYISTAMVLSSLLAPPVLYGKSFVQTTYHPNSPFISIPYNLDAQYASSGVGTTKLYVLTTSTTASASELVINGFRAYPEVELIQIGATTEGKNLGSVAIEREDVDWLLQPIVSRIANALGDGDYFAGLTPDFEVDELDPDQFPTLGELGTMSDPMTLAAVHHFEGQALPVSSTTKASGKGLQLWVVGSTLPAYKGVIMQ